MSAPDAINVTVKYFGNKVNRPKERTLYVYAVFHLNIKSTFFSLFYRYWRFSEESRAVDKDYPRPISVWDSIPSSPKGAFLSDDGGELKGLKSMPITNVPALNAIPSSEKENLTEKVGQQFPKAPSPLLPSCVIAHRHRHPR